MQTSYKVCILVISVLATPILHAMEPYSLQPVDPMAPLAQISELKITESKVEITPLQESVYELPQLSARKRTRREALEDVKQKLARLRKPWLQEDNENKKICAVIPEQCRRVKHAIIENQYTELHRKELWLFMAAICTSNTTVLKEIQRHIDARTQLVDNSLNRVLGSLQRSQKEVARNIVRQHVSSLRLLMEGHFEQEKATIESAMRESKLQEFYKLHQDEHALAQRLAFLRSERRQKRTTLPDVSGCLSLEPAQPIAQEAPSADPTHFMMAAQSPYELAFPMLELARAPQNPYAFVLPAPALPIIPPSLPERSAATRTSSPEPQELPDYPCSCVTSQQQEKP